MNLNTQPVNGELIHHDSPPSLNYDLRSRIVSNIFFWLTNLMTVTIIPIVLFYPLYYRTSLDISTILGISSISTGLPSLVSLPVRIWKLWKQDGGDRRPLSGNIMDFFMWEYVFFFIVLTVIYTVSTAIPIP